MSAKTACDVNVGPRWKKREIQNSAFRVGLAQKSQSRKYSTFKFLADPKIREEWLRMENHFTEESFDENYAITLSLALKPGKLQLTAANALPPSVHWCTVSTNTPILRV